MKPVNKLTIKVVTLFATILGVFATSEEWRGLCIFLAALILVWLMWTRIPRPVSLLLLVLVLGVGGYEGYQWWKSGIADDSDVLSGSEIDSANRLASQHYNVGRFKEAVRLLEPFANSRKFSDEELQETYYLLGLAYLALPQPRCREAARLIPSISDSELERKLFARCKGSFCKQCQGGVL